jgi:putative tryptophan/tyrosine transport system substrate-binding protein
LTAEVSGKRLEILKKVVPGLSRAAVLWNSANPALVFSWNETQGAARVPGVTRDGLTSATTEDSGRNSDAAIRAPPRRLQEPLSLAQDERLVGRSRPRGDCSESGISLQASRA